MKTYRHSVPPPAVFIKSKTRKEIAHEYGIDRKTLYNWLKEEKIKIKQRRLITPKDQMIIYKCFGIPRFMSEEERAYFAKLFSNF